MGIQRNTTSLIITQKPVAPKRAMLSGGAFRGLHGRKKRDTSKGEKNATPKPPSVNASINPCELVTREKYKT